MSKKDLDKTNGHECADNCISSFNNIDYLSAVNNKLYEALMGGLLADEQKKLPKGITVLDLFSTVGFDGQMFNNRDNDRDIVLIIRQVLLGELDEGEERRIINNGGKLEFNQEWISYINYILNEAIQFYTKRLHFRIPKEFFKQYNGNVEPQTINLKDTDDVIKFFKASGQGGNSAKGWKSVIRQIHCSLLKIAYGLGVMHKEKKLEGLDEKFMDLINNGILGNNKQQPNFMVLKRSKHIDSLDMLQDVWFLTRYSELQTIFNGGLGNSFVVPRREIKFGLSARAKSKSSILFKILSNPKYGEVDAIHDIFGLTAGVETVEDDILLLQYLYYVVFGGKGKITDKGILSETIIKNLGNYLTDDFREILQGKLKKGDKAKVGVNKKYQDIKITGTIDGQKVEFKVVLVNNQNENGYSHHGVYEGFRIINTAIRLQGYVTYGYIYRICQEMVKEHGLESYIGNNDEGKAVENLATYYTGKLLQITIPGVSDQITYYTTEDRWNTFVRLRKDNENNSNYILYPQGTKAKRPGKNGGWTEDEVYIET